MKNRIERNNEMFLFKKGLFEGMAIGIPAGIALGFIIKPTVIKIKAVIDRKIPAIKKEGKSFLNEMSKEAKEMGKEIEKAICDNNDGCSCGCS